MKYILKIFTLFFVVLCFTSCKKDFLDVQNTAGIPDNLVWTDQSLINAYVNSIYNDARGQMDWNISSPSWADEAGVGNNNQYAKNVVYGRITPDADELNYWPYAAIRRINTFMVNTENSSLTSDFLNPLKGQVYFLRAFQYFEMVKRYGGVPIITKPQTQSDSLFVKRNTTTECFAFIISDLDSAISLLPQNEVELGRITKAAAIAYKGRVLLYKASPQFNLSGNLSLWTDAYIANKLAIDSLNADGYGLFTDGNNPYNDLWFNEMNKEVILVYRHNYPSNTTDRDAAVRPLSTSIYSSGSSQPTQELVDAFPMANGKSISEDPEYNPQKFYENRDPRFYDVVVYNGAEWPLPSRSYTTQWTYVGYPIPSEAYGDGWGTSTGYYCRKAVDMTLTQALCFYSGVDFIEMRYAEVMLNYAEAANETGNTAIGYDMIGQIRKRAGIPAGSDNFYGLQPGMSQIEMRNAIKNERFVELCFENKRFWDLRRWRQLGQLTGTHRHAFVPYAVDVNNPGLGFTYKLANNDVEQALDYPNNYYFLPISRTQILNNPNLEQTKGWENGTFDPLK